jgi:hypothetical protein
MCLAVHLSGIKKLNMSYCSQAQITDAAFLSLAGIRTLDISYCVQATITDAALVPLAGIQDINISGCTQLTQVCLSHLRGIRSLKMKNVQFLYLQLF